MSLLNKLPEKKEFKSADDVVKEAQTLPVTTQDERRKSMLPLRFMCLLVALLSTPVLAAARAEDPTK